MAESRHQKPSRPGGASRPPRIVFLGNPDLAVPPLTALAGTLDVVLVVTNPDRPAGRKRHLQPTPVKQEAERLGLEVFQPQTTRSEKAIERISSYEPDFLVVVAYGEILRRSILEVPRMAPLNAHASLLPRHRGPSPISAAILSGDTETGVTTMRMTRGMDEGPVYLQAKTSVESDDTALSLSMRLAPIAASLLVETTLGILDGTVREVPQEGAPSYTKLIHKQDGRIDWHAPAASIERMIRAYHPWPAAFTRFPGRKGREQTMRIHRARVLEGDATAPAGSVVEPPDHGVTGGPRLVVAAEDRLLEILELQPEGSRGMTASEFLRGHRMLPGTRLG